MHDIPNKINAIQLYTQEESSTEEKYFVTYLSDVFVNFRFPLLIGLSLKYALNNKLSFHFKGVINM